MFGAQWDMSQKCNLILRVANMKGSTYCDYCHGSHGPSYFIVYC